MNDKTLQIPADVGACCRTASEALSSSRRLLIRELELWQDEDPAPGFEWTVNIEHSKVERLRDNLARTIEFLDWLAQHAAHGQSVERAGE